MQAPRPAWSKHESIPTGWGYDERCYPPPPQLSQLYFTTCHYIFVVFPILLDLQFCGALTQKLMGFIATSVYLGDLGGLPDNTEKEWRYRDTGKLNIHLHAIHKRPGQTMTNIHHRQTAWEFVRICAGLGSAPRGLKNYTPVCVRFSHNEFAAALDDMGLAAGRRLPVAWPNLLPGSLRFTKLKVLGPTSH